MAASWYTRVLALGSEGGDVELVQRKLHAAQSGVYDAATEARVRGLQKHHNLPVTGIVDDVTAEAIGESIRRGMVPEWYHRDLQLGDHGDDVLAMTSLLGMTDMGTVFDHMAEDVLRRFQSAHSLPTTGKLSEQDAIALGDDVPWMQMVE